MMVIMKAIVKVTNTVGKIQRMKVMRATAVDVIRWVDICN